MIKTTLKTFTCYTSQKYYWLLSIFVFLFCFNISCKYTQEDQKIHEGIIEYEIKYLENTMPFTGPNVLPRKMVLTFNDRYSKTVIEGFMGIFSVGTITDLKKRKSKTFIKVFDKKYVHHGNIDEYSCIFHHMQRLLASECLDSMIIAGLNAQCIMVYEPSDTASPVELFYTSDINVKNPNTNSPFEDIKGVLLTFEIQLSQLRILFKANEIKEQKIRLKEFQVPDNYVQIPAEKMNKILDELMTQ